MKKNILLFFLLSLIGFSYAQMSADPTHPIYTDLRRWETQGLITNLPHLRPYPVPLLKSLLETVAKKGPSSESLKATEYYEVLTGRPIHLVLEGEGTVKLTHQDPPQDTESLLGSLGVAGDIHLFSLLSVGYDLKITGYKNREQLPLFKFSLHDISADPAEIGPISLFLNMNALAGIGTENYYVQGGISRSSYGNFFDNSIVLNPQAFHTGNLSFVIRRPKWMYTQSLFVLGATNNVGTSISPNKFMSMHAITWYANKYFNLTYYENMVYGGRFDPIYLLPFVPYMIGQSIGMFTDNLQMGLSFQISPIDTLRWNTDIMIDDVNVNDLFKLKFDTKIRIAAQTGLVWAPTNSFTKLVTADYTLVVPYMYSHPQDLLDETGRKTAFFGSGAAMNYQNYTTNGQSLGATLPPNSDRVALSLLLSPVRGLDLTLGANMVRVSNQNETISMNDAKMFLASPPGYFRTDGSIFNNYANPAGNAMQNAQNSFGLLAQPTKMYVWQTSIDAAYSLPNYKWGTFTFKFGYTFEYVKNFGVSNNIFVGQGTISNIDPDTGKIKPDAVAGIPDSDVYAALEAWRNALKTLINHYFRISIKYTY